MSRVYSNYHIFSLSALSFAYKQASTSFNQIGSTGLLSNEGMLSLRP